MRCLSSGDESIIRSSHDNIRQRSLPCRVCATALQNSGCHVCGTEMRPVELSRLSKVRVVGHEVSISVA